MRKLTFVLSAAALCFTGTGCTYYKVTDNTTGREYYTREWLWRPQTGTEGQVRFKDLTTGKTVELTSAEREKISRQKATLAVGYHSF